MAQTRSNPAFLAHLHPSPPISLDLTNILAHEFSPFPLD